MTQDANATPDAPSQATVVTGQFEVPYVRVGRGPRVLLLGSDPVRAAARESLMMALGTRCCVVAPRPSLLAALEPAAGQLRDASDGAAILRGVMDGLGIERASIVAEGDYAVAALMLATDEPDRVDRVVILSHGAPAGAPAGEGAEEADARGVLLFALGDAPDPDAERRLTALLARGA